MTCVLVSLNPHFATHGALPKLAVVPPSAVYYLCPTSPVNPDPQESMEFQEEEHTKAAALTAEEHMELDAPCERLSPTSPEAEPLVEPPWWETELAPSIHKTLREREAAIGDIQFRSPQLEQRSANNLLITCKVSLIQLVTHLLIKL